MEKFEKCKVKEKRTLLKFFSEFEHTKSSAKISQAVKKLFSIISSPFENVSTCGVVVQGALGRESSAPPPSLKTIFDKVKSDNNQLLL